MAHEGQAQGYAGGHPAGGGGGDGQQREEGERESARKRRRTEERKLEEIPLLEFTRQMVVITIKKHDGGEGVEEPVPVQHHVASSWLVLAELEAIRYGRIDHLITKPVPHVSGVCKVCKKGRRFRCICCKVCLHPECFIDFHVHEEERTGYAVNNRKECCCIVEEGMLLCNCVGKKIVFTKSAVQPPR
jgi:hypothetical protein